MGPEPTKSLRGTEGEGNCKEIFVSVLLSDHQDLKKKFILSK